MVSKWIEHVQSVAKGQGISYREAMQIASKTYNKSSDVPIVKKLSKSKLADVLGTSKGHMSLHSVNIPVDWSIEKANAFITDHGFKVRKVRVEGNFTHHNLTSSKGLTKYKTIKLPNGVNLVIAK